MQVDWRIGVLIIVAVLAILLVAGLAGPRAGTVGDSGGPPACPPGHVTNQGCSKP